MNDIRSKVTKILSQLLKCEIPANSTLSMDNTEMWDSMKHIEIIMIMEEEFNISFNPVDIPKLTSMDKIINKIMEIKA